MFEARIQGGEALKRLSAQMRAEGNKGLARQMGEALAAAVEPVKVNVRREAERTMPKEGGYRTLLTASLRHRMSRRTAGRTAQLILATYADGTKERRDIRALERGNLRHPVYGRSRRIKRGKRKGTIIPNPWAVTNIRAGFHQRGTAEAMEEAMDRLGVVLEDYAGRLAGS